MTGLPVPPDSGDLAARDGARLHWTTGGQGGEGGVVVVPGAWMLAGRLPTLADRHPVVFYDMRSRGRSQRIEDPSRLGFRRDVDDLEDVRRHFGLERMSLVGFSYLGGVVARYAMAHPERVERLALLGPIPPRAPAHYTPATSAIMEFLDPARVQRLQRLRQEGAEERDPEAFCREYWRTMLPAYTASREAAERLSEGLDLGWTLPNESPAEFGRVLARVTEELQAYDWREEASHLSAPVLVLHGTEDHVAPPDGGREWAEVFPDARFEAVVDAGHLLWAERPRRVQEAILRFLDPLIPG